MAKATKAAAKKTAKKAPTKTAQPNGTPEGATPEGTAPVGDGQPSLNILGQYLKDLSFENPNAPQSLAA